MLELQRELEDAAELFASLLSSDCAIQPNSKASDWSQALDAIHSWLPHSGVTRIAEISTLDRLYIPNFYVVRPSARSACAIISSGKGQTQEQALLSALYEAFERWASESTRYAAFYYSRRELQEMLPHVSAIASESPNSDLEICWTVGYELISKEACLLPARQVVYPAFTLPPLPGAPPSTTNGLASGTNAWEAICSGLFELVERDALARITPVNAVRIDVNTLSASAEGLVDVFEKHGVEIAIYRCPSPTRIPVFYAVSRDDEIALNHLICFGAGAHANPEVAVLRAITEVSQSRAVIISGLREDIPSMIIPHQHLPYSERSHQMDAWFRPERGTSFPGGSSPECFDSFREQLDFILNELSQSYANVKVVCAPLRAHRNLQAFRLCSPQLLQ
jgi:ribosomal protein S12 methylthiotransferase accessory factor